MATRTFTISVSYEEIPYERPTSGCPGERGGVYIEEAHLDGEYFPLSGKQEEILSEIIEKQLEAEHVESI